MKRLGELRRERGLSQVGLAMKLNVSQKMISAYESGLHQPSIGTLIEISKLFNVSVDYIVGTSNVRLSAEKMSNNSLSVDEAEFLNMFRELSKETQHKAVGMMFALKNFYEKQ